MQRIELTGKLFGRLTVQEYVGNHKWKCLCVCGKTAVVPSIALRYGTTKSCGCYRSEVLSAKAKTHGMSRTKTYETWCKMISRCTSPSAVQYKHYGKRGISVCPRWEKFENFLADMGTRPAGTTLDRINNDGNYEPSNCRWATQSEQTNNTRRSVRYEGKSLRQLSEETGIKYPTLTYRMRKFGTPFPPHLFNSRN